MVHKWNTLREREPLRQCRRDGETEGEGRGLEYISVLLSVLLSPLYVYECQGILCRCMNLSVWDTCVYVYVSVRGASPSTWSERGRGVGRGGRDGPLVRVLRPTPRGPYHRVSHLPNTRRPSPVPVLDLRDTCFWSGTLCPVHSSRPCRPFLSLPWSSGPSQGAPTTGAPPLAVSGIPTVFLSSTQTDRPTPPSRGSRLPQPPTPDRAGRDYTR